jgi:hypothetical protein
MKTGDSLPCDEIPYGVTSVHFSNRPISDDPIKSLAIIIRFESESNTCIVPICVCTRSTGIHIKKVNLFKISEMTYMYIFNSRVTEEFE